MLCRRADPGSMDHYSDHDPDREMEEQEMIVLRRGQCFYDEKHQRFVTIAEKVTDKPYFSTNHIICFTHKADDIGIEWLNRGDILNMEFIQQESESYMKILEEEIHDKNREH